jgi:DNA-binding HxlR family transcriptional regulator
MSDATKESVARQPEEPTPEDVLTIMNVCEPYTAGGLADQFDDTSRWTVQRRLGALHDQGRVSRKEHPGNRVTWFVEVADDGA